MPRGRPIGKLHQADVRSKIQASQLINRLTDHVLGGLEMSPTQVRAAEVLLRKSIPDLSAVELDGELTHKVSLLDALRAARGG